MERGNTFPSSGNLCMSISDLGCSGGYRSSGALHERNRPNASTFPISWRARLRRSSITSRSFTFIALSACSRSAKNSSSRLDCAQISIMRRSSSFTLFERGGCALLLLLPAPPCLLQFPTLTLKLRFTLGLCNESRNFNGGRFQFFHYGRNST